MKPKYVIFFIGFFGIISISLFSMYRRMGLLQKSTPLTILFKPQFRPYLASPSRTPLSFSKNLKWWDLIRQNNLIRGYLTKSPVSPYSIRKQDILYRISKNQEKALSEQSINPKSAAVFSLKKVIDQRLIPSISRIVKGMVVRVPSQYIADQFADRWVTGIRTLFVALLAGHFLMSNIEFLAELSLIAMPLLNLIFLQALYVTPGSRMAFLKIELALVVITVLAVVAGAHLINLVKKYQEYRSEAIADMQERELLSQVLARIESLSKEFEIDTVDPEQMLQQLGILYGQLPKPIQRDFRMFITQLREKLSQDLKQKTINPQQKEYKDQIIKQLDYMQEKLRTVIPPAIPIETKEGFIY